MMKRINILICVLLASQTLWTGCSEDKFEDSIFDVGTTDRNEVGQWVYDNYIVPYNINVVYYWVDQETDLTLNLIPPSQEDVIPFMQMVHTGWITPYMELCGREQMKPIFPKTVQLYGSAGYNQNGTVILGTAEGGKRLILYNLDNFDPTVREIVYEYIRIMHHEFGHLLNQSKEYPLAFKKITPDTYTVGWYNNSASIANNLGFVTNYAMAEPDEDFVETLATYIVNTPAGWTELFAETSAAGMLSINRKLDVVRTYMEENYGVDIDILRSVVTQRIDDVVAGNYK